MNPSLQLTVDDLLMGARATYEVEVPAAILRPGTAEPTEPAAGDEGRIVRLRPLTIGAFRLILRAAREDPGLIPLLMIKESLLEPRLTLEQVKQLHLGFVTFLIGHIRAISGLEEKKSP